MIFGKYSQCNSMARIVLLSTTGFVLAAACGLIGPAVSPRILQGKQYAHVIELPSHFGTPKDVVKERTLHLDQYTFRISPRSPGVLLVTACVFATLPGHEWEPSSRVCSPNAFAIDTEHEYSVREAKVNEWEHATPVESESEMDDPYPLKPERPGVASPFPVPINPLEGTGPHGLGYKFRGQEYWRRGDWITNLSFGSSADGKLAILVGFDKRTLPKFRLPLEGPDQVNGLVTVDIFYSGPSREIVALDLDSRIGVNSPAGA